MEKYSSSKSKKNKILRLLPKAAQASVSFQNPHFSPARDRRATGTSQKLRSHTYPPFSGPIIPFEAREESENFETQEPTSPKISCMGQIKHRKRICNEKYASLDTEMIKPALYPRPGKLSRTLSAGLTAEVLRRKASGIKKIFGGGRKRSDECFNQGKPPLADRAPCLSQMMRFASSRDAFMYYDDWTPESGGGDWGSYGDDGVGKLDATNPAQNLVRHNIKDIDQYKRIKKDNKKTPIFLTWFGQTAYVHGPTPIY